MDAEQFIAVAREVMKTPVDKVGAKYGIDHSEIINELIAKQGFDANQAQLYVGGFLVGMELGSRGAKWVS